jgi:hypothetical protein
MRGSIAAACLPGPKLPADETNAGASHAGTVPDRWNLLLAS